MKERTLCFPTLLLLKFIIYTYLNFSKDILNLMFALNFGTIYLFQFLVLVEGMGSVNRRKVKMKA